MLYTVLQPFKTPIHRFAVGDEVDDSDIDGPLTAAEWAERGYLGAPEPVAEDVDALRQEAADLGLSPDRRWGASRIREAIEAEKAAQAEAAAEQARLAEEKSRREAEEKARAAVAEQEAVREP